MNDVQPAETPTMPPQTPLAALQARLAARREAEAHRADPAAFLALEALARRTAGQPERIRQLLLARLEAAVARYEARLASWPDKAAAERAGQPKPSPSPAARPLVGRTPPLAAAARAPVPGTPRGALGLLADGLAQRGRAAPEDGPPLLATAEGQSRPPELKALRRFRGTWSRLSAQQRLREATAQVPAQAGPLNSHHLVHRALALMQQLSPGYLEHFVGHVDALLSIEQLQSPPPPPPVKGELRSAATRRKATRAR